MNSQCQSSDIHFSGNVHIDLRKLLQAIAYMVLMQQEES